VTPGAVARLTDQVTVFYDEESERLGDEEDAVALETALALDNVNAHEVANSFDFKSPELAIPINMVDYAWAKRLIVVNWPVLRIPR
jgi:hypothetical protein